jgi:hypothetical protein
MGIEPSGTSSITQARLTVRESQLVQAKSDKASPQPASQLRFDGTGWEQLAHQASSALGSQVVH